MRHILLCSRALFELDPPFQAVAPSLSLQAWQSPSEDPFSTLRASPGADCSRSYSAKPMILVTFSGPTAPTFARQPAAHELNKNEVRDTYACNNLLEGGM